MNKNAGKMLVYVESDGRCHNMELNFSGTKKQAEDYAKFHNFLGVKYTKCKPQKRVVFTCPSCGQHRIECVMEGVNTCEVLDTPADGNFEYNHVESESDVIRWQCVNCGYVISDEDGEPLLDNAEIVNWIEENCPKTK